MTIRHISCGDLQGGIPCDVPAYVEAQAGAHVGYVMKGCGCGRVTPHTYKVLPRGHRLK